MKSNDFDIVEALWLRREKKRRAQKIIEGVPPLTYTAPNAGALKNYRIYGQTVDGESVGDLVTSGEHAGEYCVPVTVEGKNLFDGEFLQGYYAGADGSYVANYPTWICTNKLPCKPNTTYTLSFNSANSRWYGFIWFTENGDYISSDMVQSPQTQCRYTASSSSNAAYMAIDIAGYPNNQTRINPSDVTDFMLVEGSTSLPYEPYHAPVTVPIYLPEQIRKVGDEAEYIDYGEQKQHFVGGTSVDVTLPALPTIAGTNTLSVGTEVQPSKVMVRGKLKE